MGRSKKEKLKKNNNGAILGFEEKLWRAANKMRGHMDPAEYKHVVLGLIFLKYISDAFEAKRKAGKLQSDPPSGRHQSITPPKNGLDSQ